MRLLAPAKINLHLRVGSPRADGFHPLVSWMCTVGLFDILSIDRSRGRGVVLSCDMPGLACDASNLIVKAATALANSLAECEAPAAASDRGLSVMLQKRIPLGAGLGGGSSDGARVLQGLNRLWTARWSREKLAALSASLGSDLPFFFYEPSAVCRGRGELVQPISPPQPRFALLILPDLHMPTAAVYRCFDQMHLGTREAIEQEPDWQHWTQLSAATLLPLLVNDLEPAAFAIDPRLGRLRADVEQILGRIVRMSGSGSSLFSLFDTQPEAADAAQQVAQRLAVKALAVELAPPVADDTGT
ncbi:MAG: 4-(cytidine 5'-diphospho)-2-C-methyl-D-erythritol kinase [Bacillota bacterium]